MKASASEEKATCKQFVFQLNLVDLLVLLLL